MRYFTSLSRTKNFPAWTRIDPVRYCRPRFENTVQPYPKHYCGVFGVFGHPNAAELAYYGLYALQHRGQESAGIVSCDGTDFYKHHGMGLVSQVFTGNTLHGLAGHMAVGHTRYSTTGSSHLR